MLLLVVRLPYKKLSRILYFNIQVNVNTKFSTIIYSFFLFLKLLSLKSFPLVTSCMYSLNHSATIFKRSKAGLISIFSFSLMGWLIKTKLPRLPYYLPITGDRRERFMTFPRVLARSKMQAASCRIWTPFIDSISNENNHNVKHATLVTTCSNVADYY